MVNFDGFVRFVFPFRGLQADASRPRMLDAITPYGTPRSKGPRRFGMSIADSQRMALVIHPRSGCPRSLHGFGGDRIATPIHENCWRTSANRAVTDFFSVDVFGSMSAGVPQVVEFCRDGGQAANRTPEVPARLVLRSPPP